MWSMEQESWRLGTCALIISIVVWSSSASSSRETSIRDFALRTLEATAVEFAQYYPKGKQLSERRLTKKLADHFNPGWMAIEKPYGDDEEPPITTKNSIDGRLLQGLRDVNFSTSDEVTMKPFVQKLLEKWLLEKASCPVRFSWKDIGGLFWPRWIKVGECATESPCSWPPGMHCVPAESHTVYVLRWHCRKRKRQHRKLLPSPRKMHESGRESSREDPKKRRSKRKRKSGVSCKWLTVPYPVTNECYCSC